MFVWALFLLHGARVSGAQVSGSSATPDNITVHVLDSKTVQVAWSTSWSNIERFDVTYNPTEDKIVSQAAGNSQSIVLRELQPDTQYQVTITAVIAGKNYKSRRIVFRTSADESVRPEVRHQPTQPPHDVKMTASADFVTVDPTAKYMPQTSSTVRGVELGLVLLALVVWIVAIALFFHRWGKIRMLLPYQPDYKTQQALKVPGTGTTIGSGCTGSSGAQGQQEGPGCIQHLRWSSNCHDERFTAKKREKKFSPVTVAPPQYSIPERESRESIALCQWNRADSPEKRAEAEEQDMSTMQCRSTRQNYDQEGTKSELEPLFFVGEKELYYEQEETGDASVVVHCPAEGSERPKRYTRSSLKKQKVQEEPEPIKSRDTAEMKRKTFLRKVSLQDTYLNYNQDYWLNFKKSVRFHNSIDLGYFGSEETKVETPVTKLEKPRLSKMITEKSFETEEPEPVMGDFLQSRPAANLFLLPSSENIPLFSDRNGHIETDFDVLDDEEDCLLLDTGDDFSQFYEVKLTGDPEPVRRSTVFNFHGGHAFSGENQTSISDESDVFFGESDVPGESPTSQGFPARILFISGSDRQSNSGVPSSEL